MRIAICDDSALDRDLIEALLRRYFSASSLRPELLPYERGDVLVQDVQDGLGFDIVFLDIYMSGHLGIDIARQLRALGFDGRIIFLTATPDFAVDSYDVEASGYLLKPLSLEKLSRVMDRVLQAFQAGTYAVRQRANVIRIPLHEILYVESSNSKCLLHRTPDLSYTIYKRLDEIQQELGDQRFLRCHQSYLVNMDHIVQADSQFLLDSGDAVLIRQRDRKAIRQAYLDYAAARHSPSPA